MSLISTEDICAKYAATTRLFIRGTPARLFASNARQYTIAFAGPNAIIAARVAHVCKNAALCSKDRRHNIVKRIATPTIPRRIPKSTETHMYCAL